MNYSELQRGVVEILRSGSVTQANKNIFIIAARNAILADPNLFYSLPVPPTLPARTGYENTSAYANRCVSIISTWFYGVRTTFDNPTTAIRSDTETVLRALNSLSALDISNAERALSDYLQTPSVSTIDFARYGISRSGSGSNTKLEPYAIGYSRRQTEAGVAVVTRNLALEYNRITYGQSTMSSGVDPSVQLSVTKLLHRYGGVAALTRTLMDASLREMEAFLATQSSHPRYGEMRRGFTTDHRATVPSQHSTLGLNIEQIMVLVWVAVKDTHSVLDPQQHALEYDDAVADPSLSPTSPHYGKTKRQVVDESIQCRKRNFMMAFAEFAMEYGDHAACAHGTYNKLVETLNLTHPDVLVVQDLVAAIKARAEELIRDRFLRPAVSALPSTEKAALLAAWTSSTQTFIQLDLCRRFVASQRERINRELLPLLRNTEFPTLWANGSYSDTRFANELMPSIFDGRFATVWEMQIGVVQAEDPEQCLPEDMQELSYSAVCEEMLEAWSNKIALGRSARADRAAQMMMARRSIRDFEASGAISPALAAQARLLLTIPIPVNAERDIQPFTQALARARVDGQTRAITRYRALLPLVLEEGFPLERAKEIVLSMIRSGSYEELSGNVNNFLLPTREYDDVSAEIIEHAPTIVIPTRYQEEVVRNLIRIASTQLGIVEPPLPVGGEDDVAEADHDEGDVLPIEHAAPAPEVVHPLGFDPGLDQDAEIQANIGGFSQCALSSGFSGEVNNQWAMRRPGDGTRIMACYGGEHGMAIPAGIPCVLPYEINGLEANRRARGMAATGVPTFSIAAKLSSRTIQNLPPQVVELLVAHRINMANFSVNFLVQDMPWQDIPLRLRSNPFTDPDATALDYNREHNILSGIANVDGCFVGPLATVSVSTHQTRSHIATIDDPLTVADRETIFSPPNQHIMGIEDYTKTHAFYSLNIDPTTGRAALTLHWLLNDADHTALQAIMQNEGNEFMTLEQLMNFHLPMFANSAINGTNPEPDAITPLQALRNLTVDGYDAVPAIAEKYRLEESVVRQRELSLQRRLLNSVQLGFEDAVQAALNKGAMPTEEIIALARASGNANIEGMLQNRIDVIQATANSQRLLQAVSEVGPEVRGALIEREVMACRGNFDPRVVFNGHNILFYARNYGCSATTITLLESAASAPPVRGTARANAERLLQAITETASRERGALIDRMVIACRGNFDLAITMSGQNILFYARNYGCSAGTISLLESSISVTSVVSSPRANAERLLQAIMEAEPVRRQSLIEREVASCRGSLDLTVTLNSHNILFYARNYGCNADTISLLERAVALTPVIEPSEHTTITVPRTSVVRDARENAQRLLQAIADTESATRRSLIEREVAENPLGFDLNVEDQHHHSVLFYARNYACRSEVIERLRMPTTGGDRSSSTLSLSPRAAADMLLQAIMEAESSATRRSLIEQAVAENPLGFDLSVEDQHHHNLLFYARNYACSSSTIAQIERTGRYSLRF